MQGRPGRHDRGGVLLHPAAQIYSSFLQQSVLPHYRPCGPATKPLGVRHRSCLTLAPKLLRAAGARLPRAHACTHGRGPQRTHPHLACTCLHACGGQVAPEEAFQREVYKLRDREFTYYYEVGTGIQH